MGINIQYDYLTATNPKPKAQANTNANTNILDSSHNQITITGNDHLFNELSAGYTGINIQYDNLTFAYGFANANAHSNTFSSNTNQISITGNNNNFNNISSGYAGINIQYGNLNFISANANANTSNNIMNSNANQISITGNSNSFHDISSGYTGINIQYDNLTALRAYAYANAIAHSNTLSNSNNQITVNGNDHTFHDIRTGYAGINIQHDDLNSYHAIADTNINASTLSSNHNQISISGNNNSFNNINSGYTGINIQYGDLISDIGSIEINATKTSLSASNNTINLTGSSTINGSLHTGDIDFNINHGIVKKSDGTKGTVNINLNGTQAIATHNTISIDGEHHFTDPEATLYGGYLTYNTVNGVAYKPESYDVFTGNTLNYANKTPIRIKEIANFQTYNFTLTPELGNTGTALISAQNVSLGANQNNISTGENTASDMKVSGIHSGKLVSTGTEFVLLKGDNFAGNATAHRTTGAIQQGISLIYDVETKVDTANKQVTATILSGHDDSGPKVNPQLKSIVESNLAGLMLLTRSGDDLADDALKTIALQNQKKGLVPFVYSSGHIARYNTDSTIDANGGLITAGLSFQNDKLTLAVFSENGWASFDTTSHFDQADSVKANGTNRFHGGGLLAQYDFDHGLYTDASLRAGRLYNSYKTDDIRNAATGETARFKINDSYLGGHVGIGYQFTKNTNSQYDLNLKYLWAKTDSHDLIIAGDPIHLEQLKSNRLRLNGENSYQFNPNWSLLSSVGLEYEFDAKAQGLTYDRFTIDPSDVTGLSALGSIGVRYQPVNNQRLTVDFKGSGYVGERDGGSALLHLKYAF